MSISNTQTIVLASGNAGKLRELQLLLADHNFDVRSQSEFDVPEAIEDGLSFVENAIIKARNACKHTGHAAIADDSGLEVDALQGQPGIYSSRYAGPDCNDSDNNQKLLNSLEGLTQAERTARFQCVLVYMRHAEDPSPIICQGSWEGRILQSLSGEGGFGYDPLFYVPEQDCAAAELSKEAKSAISHRGKAMAKLLQALASKD
ncbi:XTP/dITP diphosphatase [Maricurvus nonylphenolicus]|uniref:RdgB/HAM1 family non-canonical purine NTP pyrophosphatase n=1 Tax=Maricurvus nonylphenolicus TaxID=1008307 RepID=UPI0036F38A6B